MLYDLKNDYSNEDSDVEDEFATSRISQNYFLK